MQSRGAPFADDSLQKPGAQAQSIRQTQRQPEPVSDVSSRHLLVAPR
jgi:hypothetical protein